MSDFAHRSCTHLDGWGRRRGWQLGELAHLDRAFAPPTKRMESTMRRRDFLACSATALTGLLLPLAGRTQSGYPTKQIHLVVPTSAGGVHDVIGRIWADRVKSSLGTIIIENRAGGGSS